MRDDNENIEFEKKYKEHLEIDTPDLWSRIEAGIDGVKPGSSEDESGNEEISNKESNNKENKNSKLTNEQVYRIRKTLLMVACFSVVVLTGITIKEKLFGGNLEKSNCKSDSISNVEHEKNDIKSPSEDSSLDKNNSGSQSSTNAEEQYRTISKKIKVIDIKEDIGDTYVINAKLLDEDDGASDNINIYISGDLSTKLKIGNNYEVLLEHYNSNNDYYLKEWKDIE